LWRVAAVADQSSRSPGSGALPPAVIDS